MRTNAITPKHQKIIVRSATHQKISVKFLPALVD
jgi:hypothetical protein